MTREVAVRMPKMSMTMTEGDISTWLVEEGDEVNAGDAVCEVMTDKVDMEVESPASGTLVRIIAREGTIPVGEPIAYIASDDAEGLGDLLGDDFGPDQAAETESEPPADTAPQPPSSVPPAPPEPQAPPAPSPRPPAPPSAAVPQPGPDTVAAAAPASGPVPGAVPVTTADRPSIVPAVPAARRLARERGLDLALVSPSQAHGIILVADVERAVGTGASPERPAAASLSREPANLARRRDQVRVATARRMLPGATVPTVTVWRDLLLDNAQQARGAVLWETVFLHAYARALRQHPDLLGTWSGAGLAPGSDEVVIGVALDTPAGMLAPAFADPDRSSPTDLDAEVRASTAAAWSGRMEPRHLRAANATLSYVGDLGVDRAELPLTVPQTTVLTVGAVSHRPVAVPGGLGVALTATFGLTVDHRVADAADGARLLAGVADLLGNPRLLAAS